ncbi:calcium-binding protein [Donghicola sp. XS_ASV15]|uniref:calcium-binding protein n=1 Tax=Donghicola sp. XS_ASV15 TaxID=3241295 RepID=UPI003514E78F
MFKEFLNVVGNTAVSEVFDAFDGDYVPQFFVRKGREDIVVPHLGDFEADPTPTDYDLYFQTTSTFSGGSSGSNYVVFAPDDGASASLSATNGNNALVGNTSNDSLSGGMDRDVLVGGAGDDVLNGGGGSDTLYVGAGNDTFISGSRDAVVFGGVGHDTVTLSFYRDSDLSYNAAIIDTLGDGAGAAERFDAVRGDLPSLLESGDLVINTNPGTIKEVEAVNIDFSADDYSDTSYYEIDYWYLGGTEYLGRNFQYQHGDNFFADWSDQTDAIDWTSGRSSLMTLANGITVGYMDRIHVYLGEGNDSVTASTGTDFIDGGAGDDVLDGGGGSDTLYGGAGSDILSGSFGDGTIVGGKGSDVVNYNHRDGE